MPSFPLFNILISMVAAFAMITAKNEKPAIKDGFISINGVDLPKIKLDPTRQVQIYSERLNDADYQVQSIPHVVRSETLTFVVPEDNYFFMGDNRDNSSDSRVWGFVTRNALKGRVEIILMNLNFENYLPRAERRRFFKNLG